MHGVEGSEDRLGPSLFFQQVAELEQGGGIGDRLSAQMDAKKPVEGLAVVDGICQGLVHQTEPLLQKVEAQHLLHADGRTALELSTIRIVIRGQHLQQPRPRHDDVHFAREAVTARGLAFGFVLGMGEGKLLGHGGLDVSELMPHIK